MIMDADSLDLDDAVVIAVGGNLPGPYDSVQAALAAALERFSDEGLEITVRSSWWGSQAWPDPADPPFLNAVVLARTALGPAQCLAALHRIEARLGRERGAANAPRTLDLDLIAHGRVVLDGEEGGLILPHPRAHDRAFVMRPLAQVAPQWRHPVLARTAAELAETAAIGSDARPVDA